jgi:hypothetical protein
MPNARETLAAAHQRMTPDDIAAHALLLAQFVEAQAGLVTGLVGLVEKQGQHIELIDAYNSTLMIGVRRVQSLFTRKQRAAALHLLADIASNEVQRPIGSVLDVPAVADANQVPASLFDPTIEPNGAQPWRQ